MQVDAETLRFIFGFKLKNLRAEKKLSLKTLSEMTGLSPSYINEIEKGKKYPKTDKVLLLASSLGVSYDELTSVRLKRELRILAQMLGNNLIRGLPFDVFGIPASTIFEIIAERPQNFSALVGTILELSRAHGIRVEDFFHATLRSYLDTHNNYFPDLEDAAARLREGLALWGAVAPGGQEIRDYLTREHGYEIREVDMVARDPALAAVQFHFIPGKPPRLLLNQGLAEADRIFILAREAGYQKLGLHDRLATNLYHDVDSFDSLLANLKASYFAGALLIPRDPFVEQARQFLAGPQWSAPELLGWLQSWRAPGFTFFHRLSQILPGELGLEEMFFLRVEYEPRSGELNFLRELHLSELHAPHGIKGRGSSACRRWLTVSLLESLAGQGDGLRAGVQRSSFWPDGKEYLALSLAYPKGLDSSQFECVTLGIRLNEESRRLIGFLDDPVIPRRVVADHCETCGVADCAERVAPPLVLEQTRANQRIEAALKLLC